MKFYEILIFNNTLAIKNYKKYIKYLYTINYKYFTTIKFRYYIILITFNL